MTDRKSHRITWLVLVAALLTWSRSPAAAQSSTECFDVALRGGTTEVCAEVHENESALRVGATVLAIHGFTETARVWAPLADAMFADPLLRFTVRRVVALDFPGHGQSPAPVGLPGGLFGQLTINDNVSIVLQVIDALRAHGLGPRVIMGHSMGGLAVQSAQETLLDQGSSLAAHGVFRAVLLAPVPALGATWTQPPPSDLSAFVVADDPALGPYLDLPPAIVRIGGGYTTPAGVLVSGVPSVDEMPQYVGFEPITTALQLVGQVPGLPRPDAREGAFAPIRGTLLMVLGFAQDVLTPADDQDDLYRYLIGRRGLLYRRVEGAEAVHNMFISDPEGVVDVLSTLPIAP